MDDDQQLKTDQGTLRSLGRKSLDDVSRLFAFELIITIIVIMATHHNLTDSPIYRSTACVVTLLNDAFEDSSVAAKQFASESLMLLMQDAPLMRSKEGTMERKTADGGETGNGGVNTGAGKAKVSGPTVECNVSVPDGSVITIEISVSMVFVSKLK